ncbi:MAG: matrixin family metalloprotease [Gammaproteobacteria bacterium]|nr:matrixin family metalloprotease [Gammaproteobacteria bacterium]
MRAINIADKGPSTSVFVGGLLCSALLLIAAPQSSWAFSYLTLDSDQTLQDTASTSMSNQSDPVVWEANQVSVSLNLDGAGAPSKLASPSLGGAWNEDALVSMEKWNAAATWFSWERDSFVNDGDPCSPGAGEDGVNNIVWSAQYCGDPWGDDILALTQINYQLSQIDGVVSAKIVDIHIHVNSLEKWGAYDGPLHFDQSGQPIYDVKRVLLHELGHGLGLTHPDDNNQNVVAIMHSTEGDTFLLTDDDIDGVNTLYPKEIAGVSAPSGRRSSGGGGSMSILMLGFICLIFPFKYKEHL